MKTEIQIDSFDSVVRVKFSGAFDINYYRSFYVKLVNRKDFKPGMNMIWDISELDIRKINTELVMEIGIVSVENAKQRGRGKTAIFADSDHQFGTARMFGSLHLGSIPAKFQPFRTLAEAEQWINSNEEVEQLE